MKKRNTSNNPLFTKTSGYPIELITNYRAGKISRQQFQQQFSDWQKSHGINFDCKGYADKSGVYMTYRGIKAAIRNGILCWRNNTAQTFFEFQRKVDFSKNTFQNYEGVKWI